MHSKLTQPEVDRDISRLQRNDRFGMAKPAAQAPIFRCRVKPPAEDMFSACIAPMVLFGR